RCESCTSTSLLQIHWQRNFAFPYLSFSARLITVNRPKTFPSKSINARIRFFAFPPTFLLHQEGFVFLKSVLPEQDALRPIAYVSRNSYSSRPSGQSRVPLD